jgi:hypothetical protein
MPSEESLPGVEAYLDGLTIRGTWTWRRGRDRFDVYGFLISFGPTFIQTNDGVIIRAEVLDCRLWAGVSSTTGIAIVSNATLAAFPLEDLVDRYGIDARVEIERRLIADQREQALSPDASGTPTERARSSRSTRRQVRSEHLDRLAELLAEADEQGIAHRSAYARRILSEEIGPELGYLPGELISKRTIDNWRQKIERGAE